MRAYTVEIFLKLCFISPMPARRIGRARDPSARFAQTRKMFPTLPETLDEPGISLSFLAHDGQSAV